MLLKLTAHDVLELLRDYGYTIVDIAEALDMTPASLSRIYHGHAQPRRETYQKILDLAERESAKNVELCKRLISLINEGGGGYL